MTDIYLEQVAHGNLEMYRALQARSDKEGVDLFRYFNIHGSPWDEYDHNKPFVPGVGEKPKFGSFYGNPFEVTIGPYETYFDELSGLKASFEAFIGLPDKDATAALQKFTPFVPEFDAMLSKEFNFSPKGAAIPLEVVADVIRGGEAAFGQRILTADVAEKCVFGNRLLFVLGHELAHGLGPSKIKVGDREMPFEVALKDLHSSLEEAKADMLGARLLRHFHNHNLFGDETLLGILSTEIVAFFQGWKRGFTEAHARGNLIEYNWLKAAGALHYDSVERKYEIDPTRCIMTMSRLSTEFLNLQIAGDYERAKAFMEHWGAVSPELSEIIEGLSDIPTAVSPIYELLV